MTASDAERIGKEVHSQFQAAVAKVRKESARLDELSNLRAQVDGENALGVHPSGTWISVKLATAP